MRSGNDRRHARVRHVRLDRKLCAAYRTPLAVTDGHTYGGIRTNSRDGGIQGEGHAKVPSGRAAAARDRTAEEQRDQTAAGDTFRSHAQVHAGLPALAGGNMWKYIATTIGRKTIVL